VKVPPTTRTNSSALKTGFTRTDLLVVLAVCTALSMLVLRAMERSAQTARLNACQANLGRVSRGIMQYAQDHGESLPSPASADAGDFWWWYKEQVKGYVGLTGQSSVNDRLFACPSDRGYSDPKPFWATPRFDYSSYPFNGVNLAGAPNVAGAKLGTIRQPKRTLMVMEWTAHAPLSWHRSRTGKANAPFYCDAESVAGFCDGHVSLTKIYYDGYSAAYTRDPIPGYTYQYSGQ